MTRILKSVSHAAGIVAATFAFGGAFAQSSPAMAAIQPSMSAPAEMRKLAVPVKDYDVYVDLPTRFAFIKTPAAWKFIGQLDAVQMSRLPAGTLTALLQEVPEGSAMAMAGQARGGR